jgi:hypothetical protein
VLYLLPQVLGGADKGQQLGRPHKAGLIIIRRRALAWQLGFLTYWCHWQSAIVANLLASEEHEQHMQRNTGDRRQQPIGQAHKVYRLLLLYRSLPVPTRLGTSCAGLGSREE